MANKIDKVIEEYAEKYINKMLEKVDNDIPIAMNYMVDELKSETTKMFNELITQFYIYETTSYVRHWEGKPGTQKGSNMYYSFHCKKKYKKGYPYLMIEFDADDVEGGYEYDSEESVVDYVMSGVRFPYSKGERMKRMEWRGLYSGKYFSYRGTPYDIFDSFFANFQDIATPIFFKKFRELGWR